MNANVGATDKTIRIVLGALLIIVGLFARLPAEVNIALFVVAAVIELTAFMRFCPLYWILKIRTITAKLK
jgi:hypothetical protein